MFERKSTLNSVRTREMKCSYWILFILSFVLVTQLSSCANNKMATENEEVRKIKTAKINSRLGLAYLENHQINRAKQKLLLALDQAPNIPETLYTMAYFLESTGDVKKANNYYLKALAVAPTRGDAHNNYGTYLCRMGYYQAAINHFLIAADDTRYLNPADAYENAGLCARKMHAFKKAKIYFKQAIAHDPTRESSMLSLAELNYRDGHFSKAHSLLKRFYTLSNPTPQSMNLNKLLEVQTKKQELQLALKNKKITSATSLTKKG